MMPAFEQSEGGRGFGPVGDGRGIGRMQLFGGLVGRAMSRQGPDRERREFSRKDSMAVAQPGREHAPVSQSRDCSYRNRNFARGRGWRLRWEWPSK